MNNISVTPDLLEAIAEDYGRSADIIENFISQLDATQSGLNSNYEGHASSNLVPSTFSKVREHLELLQICCSSVQSYVINAKEQMLECDLQLTNAFVVGVAAGNTASNTGLGSAE
jgi:uncharacterized protein YukE